MHRLYSERASFVRQPSGISGWWGETAQKPSHLREHVTSLIQRGELEIVYQPAIRLDAPRFEFFEALTRFHSPAGESPDLGFAVAAEIGLGAELEMLAVKCALKGFKSLPEGSTVSINVSPATILTSIFSEELESAPLSSIILEITEKQAVRCYAALVEKLKPLRDRGLRIAVDDAGAGYSSFRHILHIRPDIIKLDMSICRNIHEDHIRRALASALITFSRQIGCELVAEGVETTSELESLRALGMRIIQGHIVARPMKPERIITVRPPAIDRSGAMMHLVTKAA